MDDHDTSSGQPSLLFHREGDGVPNSSQYSPTMEASGGLHAPATMRPLPAASPGFSHLYGPDSFSAMMGQSIGMQGRNEPLVKKRRGRPRKYAEGMSRGMSLALSPVPAASMSRKGGQSKRGSGQKQQLAALGSAGHGFTPHFLMVAAGEDIATKIMSFSQTGPRAVCVLSANGAISNATLRQPATSGGTVTYEGRFEMLSLTGSFILTEAGGTRSRTGGLSVTLAGQDGRVVGGSVTGLLVAATPVQVILGSFNHESRRMHRHAPRAAQVTMEPSAAESMMLADAVAAGILQPSNKAETMGLTGGSPGSPLHHHQAATSGTITPSQAQSLGFSHTLGWTAVENFVPDIRNKTDISISLPGG